MAAVDLLESNWKLVQEFLQLIRRMLSRIFVRLWVKKKVEVPVDLRKLAKTFDSVEDLVLTMKSRSVKRGVEGAIALTQSHGEEVNWEKVSSSHARPLSELLDFFEKAKKYAPGIVSIITPSAASSTSMPTSSTPVEVLRCLRQALVLLLPHLLPPRSLLLRWHRFSFSL
jgi:hypothetical protein